MSWFRPETKTAPASVPSENIALMERVEALESAKRRLEADVEDLYDRFKRLVGRESARERVDKAKVNATPQNGDLQLSHTEQLSQGEKLRMARARSLTGR